MHEALLELQGWGGAAWTGACLKREPQQLACAVLSASWYICFYDFFTVSLSTRIECSSNRSYLTFRVFLAWRLEESG